MNSLMGKQWKKFYDNKQPMLPYQKSIEDTLSELHSSINGISESNAVKRLHTYGENTIEEAKATSLVRIFLNQFTSPLIIILLIAMGTTWFFEEYKDTIVIGIAVFGNALLGFFQEMNAERSMNALKKLLVPQALVIREGQDVQISATKLVPGDIVLLTSGSKVPADLRLIEINDLTIDESALTGESLPAKKGIHTISKDNLTPGDQVNIAFMGTSVVRGRGMGVVVETGKKTILGSIASQVASVEKTLTPLQEKMNRFSQFIVGMVLVGITLIFITGLIKGIPVSRLIFDVIAVAVAAIPEGLPIVVTIAMAIGIQRMSKKNTIIRTLPSVETLGSTTVICSDKTGTLTKNEMTVKKLFDGLQVYDVEGEGYDNNGSITLENKVIKQPHDGLLQLLKIGAVCNETRIVKKNNTYVINGDPTEAALIVSAEKAGMSHEKLLHEFKETAILPFESGRNFMATINHINGEKFLFVKGSPEVVAKLCTKAENGTIKEYMDSARSFGQNGLRVLAMAFRKIPESFELTEKNVNGLTFCGLQGMMDPPRAEVIAAIKDCQEAGIRVIMITGDHADTARSIGTMIGICKEDSLALSGEDLLQLSDAELFKKVEEVSVFARVAPEQKLRIVNQLMKRGEIVAVTGDGVNDAPALKAAHIGIAMGKSGTDVAKEAANMVVKNDNFASIFQAVYEGRVVFENIRKAVVFLIPTGFASIIVIIVSMLLGVPTPFLPVQLLWINLVASGIQDIALAFEPGDKHVLKQPPRNHTEGIMSRSLLHRTILVGIVISIGVLFVYTSSLEKGLDISLAQTMAVTTMVFFQFFQVWNSRSEKESIFTTDPFSNKFLFFGLTASVLAHIAVLYIPALEWLFSMQPLNFAQWSVVLLTASTVICVVEIHKSILRYMEKLKR